MTEVTTIRLTNFIKQLCSKLKPQPRRESPRKYNPERSADYYRHGVEPESNLRIDERTWTDLDMDQLFHKLDHSATTPGEQVLYALLHQPCRNPSDSKPGAEC